MVANVEALDAANSIKAPERLAALIAAELQPGEEIVWLGQPLPRLYARRALPAVLFGIPWTIFALTFFSDPPEPGGMLVSMFSILTPFLLIGVALILSPLWMIRRARQTAYVITDRRAIVFDRNFGASTTIRAFEPEQLTDLRRMERRDGSGNLILERTWSKDGDGQMQTTDHGFLAIRDVKRVEDHVRRLVGRSADREGSDVMPVGPRV